MIRHRTPHPFAPPRPGGTPTEELIDRHAHLVAVGLANCRAAQALKKEITRRQLEQRNVELEAKTALLSNDDSHDHYDPNELRDKDTGRWMTFGDFLPADLKRLLAYAKENFVAPAGKALDQAGKIAMAKLGDWSDQLTGEDKTAEVEDNRDAYAMACRIVEKDPAIQKLFEETDQELKSAKTAAQLREANRKKQEALHARDLKLIEVYKSLKVSPTNMEALSRGDQQLPVEANLNLLPKPLQVVAQGSQGLVESSPRLAAVAGLEAIGVPPEFGAPAVFGTTDQGFDLRQASITAALPFVEQYSEDITKAIAAKAGVSNEFAQQVFKKMGGSAGMTALIGADKLKEIWKQAPDKRKAALIQIAAIMGTLFIIGMAGHGQPSESEEPGGNEPSGDAGAEKPPTKPEPEPPADLKPYGGPGGGHHLPAKSAFRGDPNYDLNQALAMPNVELARLNADHQVISATQQRLYRAFANTGQKLTWDAVEKIETEALMRGGVKSQTIADEVTKRAIIALKAKGVEPRRIPWGG